MSNPAGLRAPRAGLSRPRPTQFTFAGAWVAMLVFCALTWLVAFALIL